MTLFVADESAHVRPDVEDLRTLAALDAQLPAAGPLFTAPPVRWLPMFGRTLMAVDLLALVLAADVAVVGVGIPAGGLRVVPHLALTAGLVLAWWAALALNRSYERRFLGNGTEEFQRVVAASLRVIAVVCVVGYAVGLPVGKDLLGVFLLVGSALLLAGRYTARRVLLAGRLHGRFGHRILLAGDRSSVVALAEQLHQHPLTGLKVIGACLTDPSERWVELADGSRVPVMGTLQTIPGAASMARADVVAITQARDLTAEDLRRTSYDLEGTGVDLLVAPALTNVTGRRISMRPIAGLPLLQVDEPELSGARQVVKAVFDRTLAVVALLVLAPLLLAIAVAVRASSSGPSLFRQQRVGRDGRVFTLFKFRSMRSDAESLLAELAHLNEVDGPLFKIRQDPRVTPLGRLLRTYSLDELPQLLNVALGQMSLVGPRPPLPSEVAVYDGHAVRRLLVKPGLTGLGQISGRSDLTWDETVQFDLQYVEHWSLQFDLLILLKTLVIVLRGRGAY